jgi:hypothetical protein
MNLLLSKDLTVDPELHHITTHLFYHIIPTYMKVYEQKKYSKMTRITLFHNIYMNLEWKKCYKKYHLTTSYTPQPDYVLTEDDVKFISYLNEFFTPTNVKNVTLFYNAESLKLALRNKVEVKV